jgi:hypothetical protein
MHLVEILLPMTDNHGRPFEAAMYARVREQLTNRFGGVTAFTPGRRVALDDVGRRGLRRRSWALGRRWGMTVRFTVAGVTNLSAVFPRLFPS